MKWFKPGLTKEQLNTEYRRLAKLWHPDLHPDIAEDANKNMADINNEYDKYYLTASYIETGYNAEDIRKTYTEARKEREIILAFLRRDKKVGKGFFTFNRYGKVISDESSDWDTFHGGFSLCRLTKTTYYKNDFWNSSYDSYKDQVVSKIPAKITFPNYAEMYFGLQYGEFESESTALVNPQERGEKARMSYYFTYDHIYSKQYGDVWLSTESFRVGGYWASHIITRRYAYLRVGDQIMRCGFDLDPKYYEVIESIKGLDFGYIAFQDCTRDEFIKWHDVFYHPQFVEAMNCERVLGDDLYWIDDPVVAHYARTGILEFYQSKVNFKMRYGYFNIDLLDSHIHELSIDDAEIIQDFLDKLNGSFEEAVKGMIKKGRIKIDTRGKTPYRPIPHIWQE